MKSNDYLMTNLKSLDIFAFNDAIKLKSSLDEINQHIDIGKSTVGNHDGYTTSNVFPDQLKVNASPIRSLNIKANNASVNDTNTQHYLDFEHGDAAVGNHDGYSILHNITTCVSGVNNTSMKRDTSAFEFRLELDSHANMPVVGKGAHVEYTGRTADVNAFSPNIATSQLPIVDAVVQYDCAHSGQSYLLIIRNALYVPEMNNHLIPPFIMREAGIKVFIHLKFNWMIQEFQITPLSFLPLILEYHYL